MGIIECEKVFAGIFIFSRLFKIKMKILLFIYLKAGRKVT